MQLLAEQGIRLPESDLMAMARLDFVLPPELEAAEPAEARGLRRDQVRLMVSRYREGSLAHARFGDLPAFFDPGDVLVINTSATLKAALQAQRAEGQPLELHLSTRLPADLWIIELRKPRGGGTGPFLEARPGEEIGLPAGGLARLLLPYDPSLRGDGQSGRPPLRLWIASLDLPAPLSAYLQEYGFPIRYRYVRTGWPIAYYQTVYATEPGSAEMPSAGRAFTPELITRLVARGVQVLPLLLHTGVASLEQGELPHVEFFRVPPETARGINAARQAGNRLVAVGTTTVRALETVTQPDGNTYPGEGWTDLLVTAQRGLRAVDALLTGFHEPKSSHLGMLAALAGIEHLKCAYASALAEGYLWHEFGDLHLLLP